MEEYGTMGVSVDQHTSAAQFGALASAHRAGWVAGTAGEKYDNQYPNDSENCDAYNHGYEAGERRRRELENIGAELGG